MSSNAPKVKVADISVNPDSLRGNEPDNGEFLELMDSIQQRGVETPIVVRKLDDGSLELVTGLQRLTAAKKLGMEEIPAITADVADDDVLVRQIAENYQRVVTPPATFGRALAKLVEQSNNTITAVDLAKMNSMSVKYIKDRLKLGKLSDPVAGLVDSGEIKLGNAIVLASLPEAEVEQFVDDARDMSPESFAAQIKAHKEAVKAANKEGREPKPEFVPKPSFRKTSEVKEELESWEAGKALCAKFKPKSSVEAFSLAIQWVLNFDPDSQQRQIDAHNAKKEANALKSEEAKKERAKAKAARSEAVAKRAQLEVKLMEAGKTPEEIKVELDKYNAEHGLVKQKKD